jgi:hypothetical protein
MTLNGSDQVTVTSTGAGGGGGNAGVAAGIDGSGGADVAGGLAEPVAAGAGMGVVV